jgi:hypothetical protein
MRLLLDPKNEELADILNTLLTDNIDITAREVARRHSTLKNPSAFTRNEARSALIAAAQAQQQGVRKIVAGGGGAGSLQDQAAGYRQDIKRLEAQLTHMVAAHAGLIRAVQMAGGGPALERFWRDYKAVGDAVHSLSAANAERPVTHLPLRGPLVVPCGIEAQNHWSSSSPVGMWAGCI